VYIPKEIKIGGHIIEIKIVPMKDFGTANTGGDYQSQYNLIRIGQENSESMQAEILLHEIIEYLAGMLELELEHRQVSALTYNLFQVLRDNELSFRDNSSDPKEI
jgi:hypothetical protein